MPKNKKRLIEYSVAAQMAAKLLYDDVVLSQTLENLGTRLLRAAGEEEDATEKTICDQEETAAYR